ncbi:MAG: ATP phosphoribosyltransferase regulatory subunit [Dehalococcoidia bacterium]|nr:ATP phosphoribosyltransferase regulatory subunit [Dehalococcoidia bacterium]
MSESMRCRGMTDMLPEDTMRFRRVEEAFRQVCLGWGYAEVRTPTLERLHLFTAAGTLSPQMLERVYSFLDWDGWSGERVVLRPDSTIPAARLYTERLAGLPAAKLCYVQNVFRFAQGDESREDWQCGVELIGDTQPQGDVELILMACETLQALGLSAGVKLSDPGILRAILVKGGFSLPEQIRLYDRVLDGDLAALGEVQERVPGLSPSLSGLLTVEGEATEYLDNLRSALVTEVPEIARPLDELSAVSRVLTQIGVSHRIAPLLVRNFEYYTGPVFHLDVAGRKVGGGGRYDALISLVGGDTVPASGFALEIDQIAALLTAEAAPEQAAVNIVCAAANGLDLGAAFALALALRAAGRRVAVMAGASGSSRHRAVLAGRQVVVAGGEFILSGDGGKERRLTRVADVVRAVAGSASGG